MYTLVTLLVVFILLAALVPNMHQNLRLGLWIGAAICLVLLILQVLGVPLPWHTTANTPLVR